MGGYTFIQPTRHRLTVTALLCILLVTPLLLGHVNAATSSEINTASTSRTFNILVPHYPPYSNDQGEGVLIELTQAAFNAVGIDTVFSVVPIRRGIKLLAAGEADGFIGGKLFSDDEHLLSVTSEPILYVLPTFFSFTVPLAPTDIPFEDPRFRSYRIGSIFNSPYRAKYAAAGLDVSYISNPERLIRMAEKSRVDIFASSLISGLLLTQGENPGLVDRLRYTTWGRTPMGLAIITDQAKEETQELFHRGLSIIQQNGVYTAILESYWGTGNIPAQVLPDNMQQQGTLDFDLKRFLDLERDHRGKIN